MEKFIQGVQRAGFNGLIDILADLDVAVRDQSFFNGLETIRLIANTCKHGDGPTFKRLLDKAPEFLRAPYQNGSLFLFGTPGPDDLWIEASKIEGTRIRDRPVLALDAGASPDPREFVLTIDV